MSNYDSSGPPLRTLDLDDLKTAGSSVVVGKSSIVSVPCSRTRLITLLPSFTEYVPESSRWSTRRWGATKLMICCKKSNFLIF